MDVSGLQERHENKVGEAMTPRVVAKLCLLGGCLLALLAVLVAPPENAEAAAKGVEEYRLGKVGTDLRAVDNIVADMGALRARWSRIAVDWSRLQPNAPTDSDPGYDEAYVEQLKITSAKLEAAGINVIVGPRRVPKWASNRTLWNSPPPGFAKGEYQPFYAMDTGSGTVMAAFQAMCTYLAKTLSPAPYGVKHYECWNEPNLYAYMYPQKRSGSPYFGPGTYLKMLKRFYKGVKAADPRAVVIAGANSPRGGNDARSMSPQRFAGYLKGHGAAKYFDAYSHHPYQTGGSRSPAPDQRPFNTRNTVTLYNLRQLLRLFPNKPFYLTEYGYSTRDVKIGMVGVSEVRQASYLRKAYAMLAKYRQVKVLMWFLIRDSGPYDNPSGSVYVYTGLRRFDGSIKLSWFAFAGGNSLSLKAPARTRASKAFVLTGRLANREGPLAGKRLQLESRLASQSTWKIVKKTSTREDGTYSFASVKQKQTRFYRVKWDGVTQSATRKVRTR